MSTLKNEYLDEKMAAMDRALSPRTDEELIEPIIFDNDVPKRMLYPYIKRDADGELPQFVRTAQKRDSLAG